MDAPRLVDTTAFEGALTAVAHLTADFHANERHYTSGSYQEVEVRRDFIDRFFVALGWDVTHESQRNPYEQEVKVERAEGASQRRADYAFYLAPNFVDARFFVEAKKPHGDIGTPENCFQATRYGWNSHTPFVVLTSFEQFYVLDCRYKPDIETVANRLVLKIHRSDLTMRESFAKLYWLFSREAVASGSLEKRAAELPRPRGKAVQRGLFRGGYQRIDTAFLGELDQYWGMLARAFRRRNSSFDSLALTELVQRTLDRLVFMRFLEDKGIEPDRLLDNFGDTGTAWEDFIGTSKRLDGVYNGIVFKPHAILDAPHFRLDIDAFADICERLAHTNSPYDFNAIPVHILGSIYEQFLGKVIVATPARVRVEDKPQVRKVGGVYYTPEYIVRYIVANTLGPLLHGKTPNQLAALKIIDIACGSGSFLLGAFDALVSHHGKYYNSLPEPQRSRLIKAGDCVERDGRLFVSLRRKRAILLNNIYGIDIDPQAVEVCQLSLYLDLLRDETVATAHTHQLTFHEALLPPLSSNIVCGNSIIATDVLEQDLFVPEEERQLNPLNIQDAFPAIVKRGGFDAVIGNPPYVRPHNISPKEKRYLWDNYHTFTHKADLYCCFVEQATRLLAAGGRLGYIVSEGWLRLNSFQELRRLFLREYALQEIVELPERVFADAQVRTSIVIAEKDASERHRASIVDVSECAFGPSGPAFELRRRIPQQAFEGTFEHVFDLSISPETDRVRRKLGGGPPIGSLFRVCFGLKTGDDSKFLHFARKHPEDRKLIRGEDVKRYWYEYKGEFVWYVPAKMRAHRATARPGEPERFEQPKVLVKDTTTDFAAAFEDEGLYVKDALIVIPFEADRTSIDLRFLTALINSRALRFYYRGTFKTLHVQAGELGSLPLPSGDLTQGPGGARHDEVVRCVAALIAARKKVAECRTDRDRTYYTNKVNSLDRRIEALVYSLYGLEAEDISTIEEATGSGDLR